DAHDHSHAGSRTRTYARASTRHRVRTRTHTCRLGACQRMPTPAGSLFKYTRARDAVDSVVARAYTRRTPLQQVLSPTGSGAGIARSSIRGVAWARLQGPAAPTQTGHTGIVNRIEGGR